MPVKTLNSVHIRSWECSPAKKGGETPARRQLAKQPGSRTALDEELSALEQGQHPAL